MKLYFLSLLLLPLLLFGEKEHKIPGDERTYSVLVSLPPLKQFVKKISGDLLTLHSIVPDGADPHTFEPTPKQMVTASRCDVWFYIGEGFEDRALPALESYNNRLLLVDLRKNVHLIQEHNHTDCPSCHGGADLHFYLSAKEAQIQAQTIYQALVQKYPEHAGLFSKNLQLFIKELKALDEELTETLASVKNRLFMVSHPAFGYFCRDYNFQELSIEFEGRTPTPQQLTSLLNTARKDRIRLIIGLKHLNNKGVLLIADELGSKVVFLDPHHDSLADTLRALAKALKEADQ